jgi:DNA polymerase-1
MLQSFFTSIWLVDFEYSAPSGELPKVVCMVAREFFTGRTLRYWRDELLAMREPPFNIGADALLVAYYASAEIGCFLTLGWSLPENILDLFTEFRCLTNGTALAGGNGLLGALQYFGIPSIDAIEKDSMRALAIRGGEYTHVEQQALLEYCESDVLALDQLLRAMM